MPLVLTFKPVRVLITLELLCSALRSLAPLPPQAFQHLQLAPSLILSLFAVCPVVQGEGCGQEVLSVLGTRSDKERSWSAGWRAALSQMTRGFWWTRSSVSQQEERYLPTPQPQQAVARGLKRLFASVWSLWGCNWNTVSSSRLPPNPLTNWFSRFLPLGSWTLPQDTVLLLCAVNTSALITAEAAQFLLLFYSLTWLQIKTHDYSWEEKCGCKV